MDLQGFYLLGDVDIDRFWSAIYRHILDFGFLDQLLFEGIIFFDTFANACLNFVKLKFRSDL